MYHRKQTFLCCWMISGVHEKDIRMLSDCYPNGANGADRALYMISPYDTTGKRRIIQSGCDEPHLKVKTETGGTGGLVEYDAGRG